MAIGHHSFHSSSPDSTALLAERLGAHLRPGDVVLMSGDIGAGKSHFARSLIQSLLEVPEDVPSPTFTLVQTYDGPNCEIWHADLYRLSDPDQVIELGLIDAFDTEICLVEWPDRLAELAPETALRLEFSMCDAVGSREIRFEWTDARWASLVEAVCS